jgi:hypothetical protein
MRILKVSHMLASANQEKIKEKTLYYKGEREDVIVYREDRRESPHTSA